MHASLDAKLSALEQAQQKSYLSKLPTKEDLERFLLTIDQEPKKIEQETVQLAKNLTEKVLKLDESVDKLEKLIAQRLPSVLSQFNARAGVHAVSG